MIYVLNRVAFATIRLAVLAFAAILLPSPSDSQTQTSSASSLPDSSRLRVVYPTDGDTLNFDRIRFAGSVLPDAVVSVQGNPTRVYRSGAFVGRVELNDGLNEIVFQSEDKFGIARDTVWVFREASQSPLAERLTRVRSERVFPASDISIIPGEELEVSFVGSPGGQATFSIDKLAKDVPMVESSAREARHVRGLYRGSIFVPNDRKYKAKSVEFKFRGKDGRRLKFKSRGRINLLSPTIPLVAVTTDSTNLVFTEQGGEVWMELPADVKMRIVAENGDFTKVKMADRVTGFMRSSSLTKLPGGSKLPSASIGSIGTLRNGDWIQLRINLTERVPFKIEQLLDPAALEISFFRAHQAPHWITYPEDDETIKLIKWRQENGEIFVLRVELNQGRHWGYWGRYVNNQFRLDIRRTPNLAFASDSSLRGLTITVDPGHGGEFEGAVSPTGLFEKEVNLKYALKVAHLLEEEGARVVTTRTLDTTMTLPQRVALAAESDSHIFVSLHNNSIGPSTNPLRPRGTSTYYTTPQSQAISKAVYKRLLKLDLRPFGMVSSTYFVTRQTRFLSMIVEGAFLTHPEDELLLLDDGFLDKLAEAVADGIKDYVADATLAEADFMSNGYERVQPTQPSKANF
ncbi:N-acetylmuramoyl-L-alanine amidase [bacterium]|nr:N-acetylmuramoyl-L-alanine amidase [bacterium]